MSGNAGDLGRPDLPNGSVAMIPALLSLVAWILSLASTSRCAYVRRIVSPPAGSSAVEDADGFLLYTSMGVGFYGWEHGGSCYSYGMPGGKEPSFGGMYGAAKVFTGISDAVGGLAAAAIWASILFPTPQARFRKIGVALLLAMLFDALSFMIMMSGVCKPEFWESALAEDVLYSTPSVKCVIGGGSVLTAVACTLWLLAALACMKVLPPTGRGVDSFDAVRPSISNGAGGVSDDFHGYEQ